MNKYALIIVFGIFVNNTFSQDINISEQILGGFIENLDTTNETALLNYQGGYLFIEVVIQDKKYNFLFDTGATVTIFSNEIDIKSSELSKITVTDLLGNDVEKKIFQTNFIINGTKFNKVAYIKQDLSKINSVSCFKIDGILGANIIKKCNWKFDFKNKNVYFSKTAFKTTNDENFTSIKWQSDISPLLRLKYNNKYIVALLDTGFSGMLKLNNNVFQDVKTHSDNNVVNGYGKGFITINSDIVGKLKKIILNEIELGGNRFNLVSTIIDNSKPLVGNKIFGLEDVIFNFTENQVYLGNTNEKNKVDNDLSLCINDTDNIQLEICFIWENKSTKDLKIGDVVVKINEIDTKKIDTQSYCDIQNYLKQNRNIKIVVERKGNLISATINE
ncbi:hypothetical protein [Flavobacterium sp.]|uniref:hypothetical protein n=1 Tax=Flavobacterium sp. TaxID=239 RepID=UPI0025D35E6D|nr:hypothetical protein [Flavobacterium sp.]